MMRILLVFVLVPFLPFLAACDGPVEPEADDAGAAEVDDPPEPPDDWLDVLEVEVTADPDHVPPGDQIDFSIRIENLWEDTVTLTTSMAAVYHFEVRDGAGDDAGWGYSPGGGGFMVTDHPIPPGGLLRRDGYICAGGCASQNPAEPGSYEVHTEFYVIEINGESAEIPPVLFPVEVVDPEA